LSSSKSLKDLQNIKSEDKKDEDKITFKDLLKTYYLRLSAFVFKFHSILTFINKITLFTIIIKYLRKMNMMKFI
jgi:hypothetical protein